MTTMISPHLVLVTSEKSGIKSPKPPKDIEVGGEEIPPVSLFWRGFNRGGVLASRF